MKTIWVGLGGALGSIARYHVGAFTVRRWPGFPWGTLAVNVLGSFALSIVMAFALRGRLDDTARVALGAGVLGGFTTYSSFNYETFALAQTGAWGKAAIYVAATMLGCLAAGAAGWLVARAS